MAWSSFNYDPDLHVPTSIQGPEFGGSGTRTHATFTWSQRALNYNFTFPIKDTVASGTQINILTACTYPNGTSYNFVYGDWGIVTRIEQKSSTGTIRSYVSYNYPGTGTPLSDHPTFTQQAVSKDGTSTSTWTHTVTKSNGMVSAYTVTDPLGTSTATNLSVYGWTTGLVSFVVTKNSSGTTLRTASNGWTQDPYNGGNVRILFVTSELNDVSPALQSKVEFSYTTYGNVSEVREYDYGLALTRKTQTDYLTTSAYVNAHILDRPTQVRIYDAAGTLKAKTAFAYDGGSLQPLSPTPANWQDPGTTARGNVTSVTRYATPPSGGAQTRNFEYDTAGNLRRADVDCCQSEQWGYTSGTQFAYLESTAHGPSGGTQLTTSRVYDLSTGLVTSVTDANQQTTAFEFDPMNRVTRVTRPGQLTTTTDFDDASLSPVVTVTTPIDTGKNLVSVTTADGFGRAVKSEVKDGASITYSIVETEYDLADRVMKVSNPYAPGQTPVWTESQYDALGRPTKIIPPDGSPTSNHTAYSYSGNKVTVTDPAGKQRRTYSDALGRIIRVDEPGYDDGTSGTGSATVSGAPYCIDWDPPVCAQWDTGTVWIRVDTFTASAPYGRFSTASGIANALRQAFNTDPNSPVTAGGTGATVMLTAKLGGEFTNYPLSAGFTGGGAFTATPSGGTLTGGTDGSGANGNPPTINTPLITVYTYDERDNLRVVTQSVQQRTFIYDGLGRLTTATTPEAGAVNYAYNGYNLVSTRTDARNVVTTYTYDTLNRLKTVSYNTAGTTAAPTPGVTYNYDEGGASANAMGRLTSVADGVGTETFQYDIHGQTIQLTKVINGTSYVMTYDYNMAGQLKTITYPSNRQVTHDYDSIGRTTKITSSGTDYLSNVQYNAAGAPTQFDYGNGVRATIGYNSRFQLQSLAYAKGTTKLLDLAYGYAGHDNGGNNGQITGITDSTGIQEAGRSATYTYDAWGRLKTATTGGSTQYPSWSQSWDYDRFGNRKKQNGTDIVELTIDPNKNRATHIGMVPTEHDLAGNMTKDDLHRYVFDGESHLVKLRNSSDTADVAEYKLDGAGIRVRKCVPNCSSPTSSTVYVYSGTKVIAEYDNGAAPSSPTKVYIYSGSQMLAKIEGDTVEYQVSDHLSGRVFTDAEGTKIRDQGHYPFGGFWYAKDGTGNDIAPGKWLFASYEREHEAGAPVAGDLDYAMDRAHYPRLGRFTSPDPVAGSILDPQSLNRYSYVRNDPINMVDPLGRGACLVQFFFLITTVSNNGVVVFVSVELRSVHVVVCWFTEFEPRPGGGNKQPLDERDQRRFDENRANLLKQLEKLSAECIQLLAQLGLTPAQLQRGVSDQIPWDGKRSTISNRDAGTISGPAPADPDAAARFERILNAPVSILLGPRSGSTTWAVAQSPGRDAYYWPGGFLSTQSVKPSTVFHETLHNLTGKSDEDIEKAWGLPTGGGSDVINKLLKDKGCVKD